jgi:C-terminal processing protease CtpA/Prc
MALQDVLPGGIAERAGIKPGDALVKVDGAAVLPPDQPAFVMGKVIPIEVVRDNETRAHDLDLKTRLRSTRTIRIQSHRAWWAISSRMG